MLQGLVVVFFFYLMLKENPINNEPDRTKEQFIPGYLSIRRHVFSLRHLEFFLVLSLHLVDTWRACLVSLSFRFILE